MRVRWKDLGIRGSVRARDLWTHKDLGVVASEYRSVVSAHGVVMLRIVPQKS